MNDLVERVVWPPRRHAPLPPVASTSLVLGLVAFFAGLLLWGRPTVKYHGTCRVTVRRAGGGAAGEQSGDALRDTVRRVAAELAAASPRGTRSAGAAGDRPSVLLLRGEPGLRIQVAGATRDETAARLDGLLRRMELPARLRSSETSSRFARIDFQREEAIHYEQRAWDALFDAVTARLERSEGGTAVVRKGTDPPPVNPRWERLERKRTTMMEQLEVLRRDLTEDHPLVQHLRRQIDEVAQAQAEVPRFKSPQESSPAPVSTSAVSVSADGPISQRVSGSADVSGSVGGAAVSTVPDAALWGDLWRGYQQAREELLRRLLADKDAKVAQRSGSHRRPALVWRVATEPVVPHVVRIAPAAYFAALLLGLLVAGTAAWGCHRVRVLAMLTTAEDVERHLGVPLAGELVAASTPFEALAEERRRVERIRRFLHAARLVGEWGLAAMLLLATLRLASDVTWFGLLKDHPLAALVALLARGSA